jgi:hypothetical protein
MYSSLAVQSDLARSRAVQECTGRMGANHDKTQSQSALTFVYIYSSAIQLTPTPLSGSNSPVMLAYSAPANWGQRTRCGDECESAGSCKSGSDVNGSITAQLSLGRKAEYRPTPSTFWSSRKQQNLEDGLPCLWITVLGHPRGGRGHHCYMSHSCFEGDAPMSNESAAMTLLYFYVCDEDRPLEWLMTSSRRAKQYEASIIFFMMNSMACSSSRGSP